MLQDFVALVSISCIKQQEKAVNKEYKYGGVSVQEFSQQIKPFIDYCEQNPQKQQNNEIRSKSEMVKPKRDISKQTMFSTQPSDTEIFYDQTFVIDQSITLEEPLQKQDAKKFSLDQLKVETNIQRRFRLQKLIGKSLNYQQVRNVLLTDINMRVIVKMVCKCDKKSIVYKKDQITKQQDTEKLYKMEFQYFNLMKNRPGFVQIYEIMQDDSFYYTIEELYTLGSLDKFFSRRCKAGDGSLDEFEVKFVAKQLLSILGALHDDNMVHGDLKMRKIMIQRLEENNCNDQSNFLTVKLNNFQNSHTYADKHNLSIHQINDQWLKILGDKKKFDTFNACKIILSLLTGVKTNINFGQSKDKDMSQIGLHFVQLENIKIIQDFFSRVFQINTDNIPSCNDLLNHPWLNEKANKKQVNFNIKTQKSQQETVQLSYLSRCGQNLTERQIDHLLRGIESEQKPHKIQYKKLKQEYGNQGVNKMLQSYMQEMEYEKFLLFLQTCDSYDNREFRQQFLRGKN